MNNVIELEPCPFCGGSARVDIASNGTFFVAGGGEFMNPTVMYIVRCKECACGTCRHESLEMAVKSWNRRI